MAGSGLGGGNTTWSKTKFCLNGVYTIVRNTNMYKIILGLDKFYEERSELYMRNVQKRDILISV